MNEDREYVLRMALKAVLIAAEAVNIFVMSFQSEPAYEGAFSLEQQAAKDWIDIKPSA